MNLNHSKLLLNGGQLQHVVPPFDPNSEIALSFGKVAIDNGLSIRAQNDILKVFEKYSPDIPTNSKTIWTRVIETGNLNQIQMDNLLFKNISTPDLLNGFNYFRYFLSKKLFKFAKPTSRSIIP